METNLQKLTALVLVLSICTATYLFAANSTLTGTRRKATITLVSTSGTVPSNAKKVEFEFSPDFTGTLLGVAYDGSVDAYKGFEAPPGDTWDTFVYTRTTGTIKITETR